MSASKFKLSNLCGILDYNKAQIDGYVSDVMPIEPVAEKWRSFGWHVIGVDGHSMADILSAYVEFRRLHESGGTQPVLILARTVKGKGVSFMENKVEWHGVVPKQDEAVRAVQEIQQNG